MGSEREDRRVAQQLFGGIRRLEAPGGKTVDPEALRAPIVDDPESVVRAFCTGCGSLLNISQEGARNLSELAGIDTPACLDGVYFESARCIACDYDFSHVVLKRIP